MENIMDTVENTKLQMRANSIMNNGIELVDLFVNKNYLINIDKCEPVELEPWKKSFSYMSLFEIDKIVYDKNENINDKLVSVYSALSNFGSSALLIIFSHSDGVKFYLGTRDTNQPKVAKEILKKSLRGNFPGIEIKEQGATQIERLLEGNIPKEYTNKAITSVSVVPSFRDDDKDKFVQGLEKFIDTMAGEKYTAVFVSTPLSKNALENKKRGYEELYTALSQCAQLNLSYAENDSESIASGVSDSFSRSVNEGISDTTGTSETTNTSTNKSRNSGTMFSFMGIGNTSGKSSGTSTGTSSGTTSSHTDTRSQSETNSKTTSDSKTTTIGTTATLSITKQNKTVLELLEKIDEQLDRIKNCESYGLWESACYFIADKPETSLVAANTYKALVAGEKTNVENSFINIWNNEFENSEKSLMIMESLRYGVHPSFKYLPQNTSGKYIEQIITPASMISGVELPILMGVPHKSVSGVTSITSAEFGRNVFARGQINNSRNIDLGAIYHMGEVFNNNRVRLDLESLSAHCFITGSTGSGKSNTTYKIIEELTAGKNKVNFLVIEPAKGEYKLAFGNMPGINIFTTNPKYFNMLRINPFAFHSEIHVLEHLDRLIEIFSACWPLYAAMPALLKASFERAYINHGWDLNHSFNINRNNGMFPNFKDIVQTLPILLGESEFSAQTKGDYVGSLVTRVESLTNGLIGQIFSTDAISDEVLFNENTIVDLSRIGSAETKALLMGILVLKLGEFRQSTSGGTNLPLKHVTIIEEAHNLLKRTSTEQGQESANVQGKSVEMISNSIAEMRTYGEGFIIVDQSPTAVDISAIKNTNTKILMRLPEFGDCETVGRSVGLNSDQIAELSRLDKGVAAVYQNNWLETVLTKIDKCENRYELKAVPIKERNSKINMIGDVLAELISQDADKNFNMAWFNTTINSAKVSEYVKSSVRNLLLEYQRQVKTPEKPKALAKLIYKLINCEDLFRMFSYKLPQPVKKKSQITREIRKACDIWADCIHDNLDNYSYFIDKHTKDMAFMNLLIHKIESDAKSEQYKFVWALQVGAL